MAAGKTWVQRNRARWNEYMRIRGARLREERAAAGVCTRCGKRPPALPNMRCQRCIDSARDGRQTLAARRVAAGICTGCGKRRAIKGIQQCRKCRVDARAACQRSRARNGV